MKRKMCIFFKKINDIIDCCLMEGKFNTSPAGTSSVSLLEKINTCRAGTSSVVFVKTIKISSPRPHADLHNVGGPITIMTASDHHHIDA